MSPPNQMVNLDEFFRLILTNWTNFINPQKLIAFILKEVRDKELPTLKGTTPQKNGLKITISHLHVDQSRKFILWVEFNVPKQIGTAVGTCELRFDPLTGDIENLQTLGNVLSAL